MTYTRKSMRRSEEWWQLIAGPTEVRCEGHTQNGDRCLRQAHPGATVCRQHGGAAGQVRAKAAARIGNAADEMVKRLHAMLDDPEVDAREKVKIAQDMLDRAGLNSVDKHVVAVDGIDRLFHDLLSDPSNFKDRDAVVQVVQTQETYEKALEEAESRHWEDIVDAEVVNDDKYDVPEHTDAETLEAIARAHYRPTKMPKHIRQAMEELL